MPFIFFITTILHQRNSLEVVQNSNFTVPIWLQFFGFIYWVRGRKKSLCMESCARLFKDARTYRLDTWRIPIVLASYATSMVQKDRFFCIKFSTKKFFLKISFKKNFYQKIIKFLNNFLLKKTWPATPPYTSSRRAGWSWLIPRCEAARD